MQVVSIKHCAACLLGTTFLGLMLNPVFGQTAYSGAFEQQVKAVMTELNTAENRGTFHNIPDDDGRILRLAIRLTGAKRALEVGTSNGYSSLWMGLGLKETGGTLTTIEIDAERHRMAQVNIRKAGLESVVTALHGDAADVIPGLSGPFDVAFVDLGQGELSRKFFEMILPKLRTGGVILFHAVQGQRGGDAGIRGISEIPSTARYLCTSCDTAGNIIIL